MREVVKGLISIMAVVIVVRVVYEVVVDAVDP